MAETFTQLNAIARRRAADEGLNAFTVEQLCDEAGVSRRTFFNYFASKEDAVLGIGVRDDHAEAEERFLTSGNCLVDDLAELMVARWELTQPGAEGTEQLVRAFDREPRLFSGSSRSATTGCGVTSRWSSGGSGRPRTTSGPRSWCRW